MKRIKLLSIFVFIMCTPILLAQNPLDFFPHHEGDIWEYWEWQAPNVQNIILSDSLGNDGKYYLETTMFDTMIIDTINYNVYRQGGLSLWYKLDANQGESWQIYPNDSIFIGHIDSVYQGFLFGQATTIKEIGYYYVFGAESLWVVTDFIASGFGLIRRNIEFQPYLYNLRGAIIDSVQYGNITVPIKPNKDPSVPKKTTLHQNYPNPFNPMTIIRYELPEANKIELIVYDPLGRRVKVLVDEYQSPGSYSVHFDGSGLPSGVYFYRLKTSQGVLSKKMLLLR